jgi:ubiquinone/menaquinone biosynthesis C-methylase UbiE
MDNHVDWHARFVQQAGWTSKTRKYLYEKGELARARRILEVGCGTGALLMEFPSHTRAEIHGLDISLDNARMTQRNAPAAGITCGDGHRLPYRDACFDLAFCHFLLLWVKSPVTVLNEMKRVIRPGGALLAMAEPDYAARIDYPPELAPLGRWQAESLLKQGADPQAGRKLKGWFVSAGIAPIESGIMAGGWSGFSSKEERDMEWSVIKSDLDEAIPPAEIRKIKAVDDKAWSSGERVLFVPTFYAWGKV